MFRGESLINYSSIQKKVDAKGNHSWIFYFLFQSISFISCFIYYSCIRCNFWLEATDDNEEYYQVLKPTLIMNKKESSSSMARKPPTGANFSTLNNDLRWASESSRQVSNNKKSYKSCAQRLKSMDNNDDIATFLEIESATQKEVLKEEAFDIDDIALDTSKEHPYFIQNLLNVMNNRKVDSTSDKQSLERSMDKRKTVDTTAIGDSSQVYTRFGATSSCHKNERHDKSPVMKYLSISLVKENKQNQIARKTSTKSTPYNEWIKFQNHKNKNQLKQK